MISFAAHPHSMSRLAFMPVSTPVMPPGVEPGISGEKTCIRGYAGKKRAVADVPLQKRRGGSRMSIFGTVTRSLFGLTSKAMPSQSERETLGKDISPGTIRQIRSENRTCPASPYPAYSVHFPAVPERTERRSLFTFSHFGQRLPCVGSLRMIPGLFCPEYTIPHIFSMSS